MKVLNLVNEGLTEIGYKISKFPDGQQNNTLTGKPEYGKYAPVLIKSRLNNWLDLELIACTAASLREIGVDEIHLYAPYIEGARSDRKFEEGGNNYLKEVLGPVINSLGFKTVTCLDPHSDVLEAIIKGFKKETNERLVREAFRGLYGLANTYKDDDRFILVSPDAGASKKIYKIAEQIGYNGDIITCSKDRDNDGKLNKTVVPYNKELGTTSKDVIIIDDICDGGATFINIAKEMESSGMFYGKKYLIVTHGVFSKGYSELAKHFDKIYCTNSYSDTLKGSFFNYDTTDLVKQLNVFE
jgi:ribose-phosphate pyrophosphokinase